MRFRSARCLFQSGHKRPLLGAILIGLGLAAGSAHATVTVTPHAGYGGVALDGTMWVAAKAGSISSSDFLIDSGFLAFDVTQSQLRESGSLQNALAFDVVSDKAITGTGTWALIVTTVNLQNAAKPVPIAGVNEAYCGTGGCYAGNISNGTDPAGGANSQYYFAIPYTPSTGLRVYLYPRDICTAYSQEQGGGALAVGCSDAQTVGLGPGSSALQVTFQIINLDSNNNIPSALPSAQDSATINVRFEDGNRLQKAAITCPSGGISYTPGDGNIFANTGGLADSAQRAPSGYAPLNAGILVGKAGGAAPVLDLSDLISRSAGLGDNAQFPGFSNLTASDDQAHLYNVAFLVRDVAGVVYVPTPNGCEIDGVGTSQIQGFLAKSKCFIATAAFRSIDAEPVVLLREFRDQVLAKSRLGLEFIDWYYRWSPHAAEWLMMHSGFRYPVLHALLPLEIGAWLVLHPPRHVLSPPFYWFFSLLTGPTEAESNSPYIDQLKTEMKEKGTAPVSSESYTEALQKKMGHQESPPSYIDQLKKELPAQNSGSPSEAESYTAKKKAELQPEDAGGAIQAVKEGRSELKANRQGEIHHAFGLRYGASLTRDISAAAGTAQRGFNDIYGSHYAPDLTLFYEYQPWHSELAGSLAFFTQVGVGYFHGSGVFQFSLKNPSGGNFGSESATTFQFITIPVSAGIDYRFNLMKYIRPFVMVGPSVIGYYEGRNDNLDGNRGYSTGFYVAGGASFLMDWLSPSSTWDLYAHDGIKHLYLSVDYGRLSTFAGDVTVQVSGFYAGLTFEL
ncbi:CFI-box-CTERM domain-containing protein [Bdellovibrionota bacterium FG-1]